MFELSTDSLIKPLLYGIYAICIYCVTLKAFTHYNVNGLIEKRMRNGNTFFKVSIIYLFWTICTIINSALLSLVIAYTSFLKITVYTICIALPIILYKSTWTMIKCSDTKSK